MKADASGHRVAEPFGNDDYLVWARDETELEVLKGGARLGWLLQAIAHP